MYSELHDSRCNSNQLDISSYNIVKVNQTSTKPKINKKTKKDFPKAES